MSRPLNVGKRLRELVDGLLRDVLGIPIARKGRLTLAPDKQGRLIQLSRLRTEGPSRNLDDFAYIQEVLANMPAAYAAVRRLSEDVALDESGDPRAWNLAVSVDPLDDSKETEEKIAAFRDECAWIFTDYALRTGIGTEAKNYVFKFLTAGDCFAEQSISLDTKTGFGRIEKITELPTWQMHVNWNVQGDLIGYEQRLYNVIGRLSADVVWGIPAQIIHWKYHPTAYFPYGESIFAHLRNRWEQFKLIELDTIGAIHTHAIEPEVHLLGNEDGRRLTDDEIKKYQGELRDNPTDINRFYVGRKGEIEYTFPKTGTADAVQKLVEAHRDLERRFVEALGVPGGSTNAFDATRRAVATSFDQKYARKVTSIRQDFATYLKPSIFLEFALHGIDWAGKPEQYGCKKIVLELTWPDLSESRIQREKRVLTSWMAGLKSHATSLQELGMNDVEGELALIKKEHEDGDFPLQFSETPANQQTSPNGEQGAGVSTPSDSKAAARMFQELFTDPEDFRQIIREELLLLRDM